MSDLRAVFLGDSYVAGAGDDSGLGWVGRVTAAARGQGADLTAYNLGIRGQTGPQMAWRVGRELKPRVAAGDAHALVATFGANDISRAVPLKASVAAAGRMLDAARRHRATPFLLSPPAFPPGDPKDRAATALSFALADLCARRGVAYFDLRQAVADWGPWWEEARAGDGAHPNGAGYALIAEAVCAWTPWRTWLGLAKV